jgi:DNA mismatch endonuclease, patch repair protein
MTDVHSKEIRSYNMSRIRGKDTAPEILVRKFLFSKGLRYRLHRKDLAGTPDLVFPKYRKVVFINGCFWHGHVGCKYFVTPKTRSEWWLQKISKNKKRDVSNISKLRKQGWKVIIVWECTLKQNRRERTLSFLLDKIRNG